MQAIQVDLSSKILEIRNQRVLLDEDLAALYGVPTKVLMQSVQRNLDRFPADFAFRLENKEFLILRSQIVTSSWGGRRYSPMAFTEQGVAMLSGVLQSPVAVKVNIAIMREFVRLRNLAGLREAVSRKLEDMETRLDRQDYRIEQAFEAIEHMMQAPEVEKPLIGFGREPKGRLKAPKSQRGPERNRR